MGTRSHKSAFRAALLAALACAPASAALADPGQPVGVMARLRPAYDAKGLPVGGFRLRPALDVGASYDDNVYRTSTGKVSDAFFTINPSFRLTSQWSRHRLEIAGGMTQYLYDKRTSENRIDWYANADGRLDITRAASLSADGGYDVMHEPRYSADEPGGAAEPTQYARLHGGASFRYQPNRFGIELGGNYDRYRFDPTTLIGGGVYNNADRNRDQLRATAKASYEFAPGYALFLRGTYDTRRFDTTAGAARDSHGYRGDLGAKMFLSHLVQGEIFVGFSQQSFKAPFKDVQAVDYGARLTWYATPLMTVHLTASRQFHDTTIAGASVTDDQAVGLSLDYELLRNLIIQSHVDLTDSRFVGTPRDDKLLEAGLTAKYLINRYMAAQMGYAFQRRSSSNEGQGFTDHVVQAGLHFQL